MPQISDELYELLRQEFSNTPADERAELEANVAMLRELWEQELIEVEAAKAEVDRRSAMSDRTARFNHPVTISNAYPQGYFTMLNQRQKNIYVEEAKTELAKQEAEQETAIFALRRAEHELETLGS